MKFIILILLLVSCGPTQQEVFKMCQTLCKNVDSVCIGYTQVSGSIKCQCEKINE